MNCARAGLGAAQLAFGGLGARFLLPGPSREPARTVLRVLGARQLTQAAASWVRPTPAVLVLGAEVDALHCASMLALAMFSRRWRRAALASAAIAAMLARAGLAAAGDAAASASGPTGEHPPVGLWGLRDRVASALAGVLVPRSLTASLQARG